MTQAELNEAVARVTGESLCSIQSLRLQCGGPRDCELRP